MPEAEGPRNYLDRKEMVLLRNYFIRKAVVLLRNHSNRKVGLNSMDPGRPRRASIALSLIHISEPTRPY